MSNARLTAFDILYDIITSDAYSNIAIDKAVADCDKRDKTLCTGLVYGVIERRITLDHIIAPYIKGRIKPKIRIILYIGVYQLYFMDRIPASAAINESVELAKNVGLGFYSSMINAVLHNVDANRINIDDIDDLSVRYSCPFHLINMWKKMYGPENTLAILDAINNRPPVYAVPNHRYVDADELVYELSCCGIVSEVCGEVVRITSGFDLSACKAFDDGLFYIEDLSSYQCAKALGAKAGDTVLDVCSAPGGKAFTIARSVGDDGTVYAYDLYEKRVSLIKNSADRMGIGNIVCATNDALRYNPDIPMADKILCDVPCSGFGIIRRKPEIRYKDLDSIRDLPNIQYDILATSSRYLKSGGRIMYSTCTLNKKENEKVVDRFLADHPDFRLIEQNTIFPSPDGGDGFFWSLLEKL